MRNREVRKGRGRDVVAPKGSKTDISQEVLGDVGIENHVDKTMIELIESQSVRLTDDLFFHLLLESSDYLRLDAFQEKIKYWQTIATDETIDQSIRIEAQDRLKDIGATLAFVGSGRKKDLGDGMVVYLFFQQLKERLSPVLNHIYSLQSVQKRVQTFRESFPELEEYAEHLEIPQTPVSLSKEIVMQRFQISERTLDGIIKSHKDMVSRTRAISRHKNP